MRDAEMQRDRCSARHAEMRDTECRYTDADAVHDNLADKKRRCRCRDERDEDASAACFSPTMPCGAVQPWKGFYAMANAAMERLLCSHVKNS